MKKIMKKALSLVLVMAFLLVPMTTASAATNTDPSTAEVLASDYEKVTVGAGETLYYSYGSMMGADQGLVVMPADYEGDDFEVVVVYSRRGSYVVEAVDEYEMGYGTANATLPAMMGGQVFFAIHNKGEAAEDFSVMLWDAEGSTLETAAYLVDGENVFNAYGGARPSALGNYYVQKNGTVTITMDEDNEYGWMYSIEIATYDEDYNLVTKGPSETYYCYQTGDAYKPSQTISVSEGDYVYVWVNSYDVITNTSVPGEVTFNVSYEASEKDPYVYDWNSIYAGENEVVLSGLANVTMYDFSGGSVDNPYSSTAGKYKITVPSGCTLSIWEAGENWGEYEKATTVSGTTYEFDYEENSQIYFGFEGVAGTVVIERIGDLDNTDPNPNPNPDDGNGFTNYENTITPEKYEFTGNADNLFYVWVEDGATPVAVLGEDGYYHLGTATGPILYVDLDMELHPYAEIGYIVSGLQKPAAEDRLYNYSTKVDYSTALKAYAKQKDTATGLYPVTEDIKTILVEYGKGQGWYAVNGPAYMFNSEVDEEIAWLYMCCYEGVIDTETTEKEWKAGDKEGFVFKVNAEISDFLELKINDEVVPEENYTLTEGSTIITIDADYLATLAGGKHTVAAVFNNALGEEVSFTTELTVVVAAGNPADTSDSTNFALWIAVLGLGVVALAGSVVMKKREF